ncbi:MAG: hypothetical protein ABI054_06650 [Planctomycetota bacterium]
MIDPTGNVYTSGSVGWTSNTPGDVRLIKYSPSGAVLWSRTVDVLGGQDFSSELALGAGGVVHELGSTSATFYPLQSRVITWDALGNQLWLTMLPSSDSLLGIVAGAQGNLLCLGWTYNGMDSVAQVKALSSAGTTLWSANFGGSASNQDIARSAAQDAAGNWYVAFSYDVGNSFYNHPRAGVAKLDPAGQLLWERSYPGSYGGADVTRIAVAPDGYSVAVGRNKVGGGAWGMYAVAHNAAGTLVWTDTQTSPGAADKATDVALDAQGIAWVVGTQQLGFGTVSAIRYSRTGAQLSTAYSPGNLTLLPHDPRVRLGTAGQAYVVINTYATLVVPASLRVMQLDSSGASTWSAIHPPSVHGSLAVRASALSAAGRLAVACDEGPNAAQSVTTLQIDLNDSPQAYCSSKVNSLGCSPWIGFVGQSSAAAASGFKVQASNVLASKSGLFFYGLNGQASTPFQGGTLCIQAPILRTPVGNSGGTSACSGQYALDFNAFAQGSLGGAPSPALIVPGTAVCCQAWGRDPGLPAPNDTSLSNALRYVVLP